MKQLNYSITINADRSHVWETMLAPGKYEQWVKAFSEHSQFEGRWEAGATVKFVDPNMGGSKAILEIFEPPHCILAKHIAMISVDGNEDKDSEAALQWVGSTEKYLLTESGGKTILAIEMQTHPAFVEMFDTCWPAALNTIKSLCEQ